MAIDPERLVSLSPWLQSLPPAMTQGLLDRGRTVLLSRGRRVYDIEDDTCSLFGILGGVVGVKTADLESELLGHILGPGGWFGELALMTGRPRALGMICLTDCAFLSISSASVTELAAGFPQLWRYLSILAGANSAIAYRVTRDLMIRDPRDRCLSVLQRLAGSIGNDVDIPLSQDQIAHMCLMSRGALSRILSDLAAEGLIERNYRSIRVLPAIRAGNA